MRRWRRLPTRRLIPIAGPGTGPRPRRARMRTSPRSWSAQRAGRRRRGGLAAAAAFLERAALLTPDPARRAQRLLAAARAKRDAGALDAALGLLVAAEAGPLDALQAAEVERLRGQIAADQDRGSDAARLLLSAARRLEPLDAALARETHLEALGAAMLAGDLDRPGGVREAAEAARAAPPGPDPPRAVDVAARRGRAAVDRGIRGGRAGADPGAGAASRPGRRRRRSPPLALAGRRESRQHLIAMELWDFESWHALAARQVQVARDMGALVHLQFALNFLGLLHLLAGELSAAERLIEEDRLIAEATGNPPADVCRDDARGLAGPGAGGVRADRGHRPGWRPDAARAGWPSLAAYASAVLDNGLGRYDAARDAAWQAFERDQLALGHLVVAELAEAAARTGDVGAGPGRAGLAVRAHPGDPHRVGAGDRGPGPRPAQRRRGRRRAATGSRSSGWAGPGSAPSWPGRTCCTGSGCAGRAAAWTRGSSCAPPTTCWTRWAWRRSPSGPGASCGPPARPSASAPSRPPAPPGPVRR